MTPPKVEFNFQVHLDQVSRSFAVAITYLENPLKDWISLSYLLCRILDTVEDAPWSDDPIPAQTKALTAYNSFKGFLTNPLSLNSYEEWRNNFPAEIPEGENFLLNEGKLLLQNFHSQPAVIQTIIRKPVLSMARGMAHYTLEKGKGHLILKSLSEVNQYCLFVAGVVGELLENLFYASDPKKEKRNYQNLLQAYHFGLFLQKVNILKDQFKDEKEGRFFVPHRQILLKSVAHHARSAVDYLKSIRQPDMGYRMFCAFSLFLGISTLPMLSQAHGFGDPNKMTRKEAHELMGHLKSIIQSNEEVENLYNEIMQKFTLDESLTTVQNENSTGDNPMLHNLYEGAVQPEEWKALIKN